MTIKLTDVAGVHPVTGLPLTVTVITGKAEGAIPIGAKVIKCNSKPGDTFPDGTPGVIYSSQPVPADTPSEFKHCKFFYFVRFIRPDAVPMGILDERIKVAPDQSLPLSL